VNEFETEHIEGAVNINVNELGSRLDEVPRDETILVYCRTGARSVTASNILVDAGYTDVYNMPGGINKWKTEGYPYVSGSLS
ncbi:MAG: rhodanese-like domain-containing protein, partial [Methanosarcinales archaeon]|nr:rhodanese-like domain-containing protein [Methanosarcinales archaeon]